MSTVDRRGSPGPGPDRQSAPRRAATAAARRPVGSGAAGQYGRTGADHAASVPRPTEYPIAPTASCIPSAGGGAARRLDDRLAQPERDRLRRRASAAVRRSSCATSRTAKSSAYGTASAGHPQQHPPDERADRRDGQRDDQPPVPRRRLSARCGVGSSSSYRSRSSRLIASRPVLGRLRAPLAGFISTFRSPVRWRVRRAAGAARRGPCRACRCRPCASRSGPAGTRRRAGSSTPALTWCAASSRSTRSAGASPGCRGVPAAAAASSSRTQQAITARRGSVSLSSRSTRPASTAASTSDRRVGHHRERPARPPRPAGADRRPRRVPASRTSARRPRARSARTPRTAGRPARAAGRAVLHLTGAGSAARVGERA